MVGAEFLSSQRLSLRPVEPEDYEFIHKEWNTADVRGMTNQQTPLRKEDVRHKIESNDSAEHFILWNGDSRVGFIWLFDISKVNGRAEVGYWISKRARGAGYATEAVESIAQYAFNELRLHKLVARVFEGNGGSMNVLEKVGFEQEGIVRDHYFVDGDFVDTHLYGLFVDSETGK